MNILKKCQYKDCKENAISLSQFCYRHIDDKKAYSDNLAKHIKETNSIKNFYLKNAEIAGFDFIKASGEYQVFLFLSLFRF